MGSFTEVVLSFDLRADTPTEVLAAFSALARPLPEDAHWGPAPELPEPVKEPSEFWEPDWREAGYQDEFEAEPWRHEWAPWLSGSMSVMTQPSAALVWTQAKRWNFACRCSFKTWAEAAFTFLRWLGPFVETYQSDEPVFIGYLRDDSRPRPCLVWADSSRLEMEDLNHGPR